MKRILLIGALASSIVQSTYGFDDVDQFQKRIKILDSYKNVETIEIQTDADKKIKEVESLQHPNFLSFDKKIQTDTVRDIKDQAQLINKESESISFSHIEKEIKKLRELKQQRQNYLNAESKKEELKNNSHKRIEFKIPFNNFNKTNEILILIKNRNYKVSEMGYYNEGRWGMFGYLGGNCEFLYNCELINE